MYKKTFTPVIAILLLCGCTKSSAPINFNCLVNGSYLQGTGVTYYTDPPTFQFTMNGTNTQAVTLFWYNIDSAAGIHTQIPAKTYAIPSNTLPPFTVSGSYTSQFGAATYNTGSGQGGSITVTSNTGVGGTMSGTFYFNAINTNSPYDTIHITNGTFTNIRVGTS
jgi:hypothetical protein